MGAKEMRRMQHRIILEPVGENEVDEGVSVMQEEQKWRRGGEVGWWDHSKTQVVQRAEDELELGVEKWPAALFEACVHTSKKALNSL